MGQNKVKRYFYSPMKCNTHYAGACACPRPSLVPMRPADQALGALGPLRARNYCVTFELALETLSGRASASSKVVPSRIAPTRG